MGLSVSLNSLYKKSKPLGDALAAYKRGPDPDPADSLENMRKYLEWLKSGEGVKCSGVPVGMNPHCLVAARYGGDEGDGDDDMWCNLTNYGPFSENEEYAETRKLLHELQAIMQAWGKEFRQLDLKVMAPMIKFMEQGKHAK